MSISRSCPLGALLTAAREQDVPSLALGQKVVKLDAREQRANVLLRPASALHHPEQERRRTSNFARIKSSLPMKCMPAGRLGSAAFHELSTVVTISSIHLRSAAVSVMKGTSLGLRISSDAVSICVNVD